MSRTLVTETRSWRSDPRTWLIVILILVSAAGLTWTLLSGNRSQLDMSAELAAPAAEVPALVESIRVPTEMRAPDAYSAELDLLRRQAQLVAGRDSATAYALQLEALARAGRQAQLANWLPSSPTAYSVYLDGLRQMGQAVYSANRLPADPNEYSEWLDQLRRMSP